MHGATGGRCGPMTRPHVQPVDESRPVLAASGQERIGTDTDIGRNALAVATATFSSLAHKECMGQVSGSCRRAGIWGQAYVRESCNHLGRYLPLRWSIRGLERVPLGQGQQGGPVSTQALLPWLFDSFRARPHHLHCSNRLYAGSPRACSFWPRVPGVLAPVRQPRPPSYPPAQTRGIHYRPPYRT